MIKEPKLTDERCKEISKSLDLRLFNAKAHNGNKLTIKKGNVTVDTIYSFEEDKSYASIVKKMKGDVLVLGLGFGKSILEACASSNVKSVTVVEIESDVIDIFWAVHRKEFKGVKKLRVINKDALEYENTKFTTVFIDIIHDVRDISKYKRDMAILTERFKDANPLFIDLKV
jgi:spermidine synthase